MSGSDRTANSVHGALPEVLRTYINAYNSFNVGIMLECLDESIHFTNITDGKISAETAGIEAFELMAQQAVCLFSSREQIVRNSISVSNFILVEIDYQAIVAKDLPNGWRAGSEIQLTGKSLFELDNKLICRLIDEA